MSQFTTKSTKPTYKHRQFVIQSSFRESPKRRISTTIYQIYFFGILRWLIRGGQFTDSLEYSIFICIAFRTTRSHLTKHPNDRWLIVDAFEMLANAREFFSRVKSSGPAAMFSQQTRSDIWQLDINSCADFQAIQQICLIARWLFVVQIHTPRTYLRSPHNTYQCHISPIIRSDIILGFDLPFHKPDASSSVVADCR